MKTLAWALLAVAVCSPALAAKKNCDELKAAVETKMQGKGVKHYELNVVDTGQEGDAKVVGSCEGGTKKVVYKRGAAPAKE